MELTPWHSQTRPAAPAASRPIHIRWPVYDQHEEDKIAQRQADKWLITGTAFMGTLVFGFIGLPIFLRGLYLQRKAPGRHVGAADPGHPHRLPGDPRRVHQQHRLGSGSDGQPLAPQSGVLHRLGNYADNSYFWGIQLTVHRHVGAREKGWEIACIFVVFPMRIAAGIAFLQMKRWGHQWLIVTCWMGGDLGRLRW